jgi:SAM-dependent methyltransferase
MASPLFASTTSATSTEALRAASQPPDPQHVANWLGELTGRPRQEVLGMLANECACVGHNVRAASRAFGLIPHVWNDRLLEFYAHTDAFLFETAAWNACGMKRRMREYVCRTLCERLPPGSRVLCFGDGMGFDSQAIAQCGLKVTCYEVSGPCLEFARRLFAHRGSDVTIQTDASTFREGEFDAIVCLDVLEHVPDPPAVVAGFSRWLRPGGLLVAHAPFYHCDDTRPTHLKSNQQFSGMIRALYGAQGFRLAAVGGLLLDPLVLVRGDGETRRVPPMTRLKAGVGQCLAFAAKLLPRAPGLVARVLARPEAEWQRRLRELARSEGVPG